MTSTTTDASISRRSPAVLRLPETAALLPAGLPRSVIVVSTIVPVLSASSLIWTFAAWRPDQVTSSAAIADKRYEVAACYGICSLPSS
ncbi:hypothetical protein [Rhodopseudomonas palustris]|uniref:hypothetical protein n=1 Tax=Rhodopseudomonas palustris TaxID=1076 RepID=UPI0012EECB39|nr:hypothetical protein [Rhodopseudomonas palustris]